MKKKLNKVKLNLTIDPKLKGKIKRKKGSKTYSEFFSNIAEKELENKK